jgi:hypothetical protein
LQPNALVYHSNQVIPPFSVALLVLVANFRT